MLNKDLITDKYNVTVISVTWQIVQIKSIKSLLILLYYAEACSEFAGPILAWLRPGNTTFSGEMLQRWRAVGNTVPDLTDLRFGPQTSRSRDESVVAS